MQTLQLNIQNYIAHVKINRPEKANALDQTAWNEIEILFTELDENDDVRVVVIEGGESKHFCAGIDLSLLMSVSQNNITCEARRREKIRKDVLKLQAPINAIENCSKPVLAAIHGGCIGGGIDLVVACDMRYCTDDAYFTIKEIDMGMVADLGTLQRLPKLIGEGMMREMAFTGRNVEGQEAEKIGIVNRSFTGKETSYENCRNHRRKISCFYSGNEAHFTSHSGLFRSRRLELCRNLERRHAALQ
jgi:enoyl-CoA hydratase